jgi:hypothetical protein
MQNWLLDLPQLDLFPGQASRNLMHRTSGVFLNLDF